ncbi:Putative transcription factor CBF/NF-Y/archaeal histone domain, histone-fold [Septoria linicola]|uniref:Transcription factor CBF/NF-Y/archaeal histone domain, histone-fold n=1 Tax=Septoria linicola TaxID=215465 RepID=A0A9Q9AU70_9PEZI|nr:putative transcription factor CBF/NF-Y/archaeal histone domain, histone-fold [Septoria linicola]USW52077.1 Putative transcription factor CBF/NF-Y/archaeal histone domain, histone-fold [Septoria linicola]
MDYRPQSPDLSGLAEPSGYRPSSPQLGEIPIAASPPFSQQQLFGSAFAGNNAYSDYHIPVTSIPQQIPYDQQFQPQPAMPASTRRKQVNYAEQNDDEDDFMPDAPVAKKSRRVKQEQSNDFQNGESEAIPPPAPVKSESNGDPTLGCQLKTSFPVARIKRIMQADEDIGKVAQVTPTVVSRALELFMTKLISAAAHQARGPEGAGGATKGPRRVLAQHLKKAIAADEKLDFLEEIVSKVPDAPTKAKKEVASDSEDTKPKKKGKKRKDSGDDF